MKKEFGIQVISNSCGVLPHTLRTWEQRYQVFNPKRLNSGQRLYNEDDLIKAKLLAKLLKNGHSISSLASYSNSELKSMIDLIKDQIPNYSADTKNLLKFLADYNIDLIASEFQHLRLNLGAKSFIFGVVLPIMKEIGLMVVKKKYTITQEHIISTIIRDQLSQIYLPNIGKKSNEMALATPEGNLHELSIIIADILCRANRITTRYLGSAHPAECLAQAINALKCPYLILGTLTSDQWNYQTNMIPFLEKIDEFLTRKLVIILGGGKNLAFPIFKNISKVKPISTLDKFDKFLEEI